MRSYKVNKIVHRVYEDEFELPPGLSVMSNWRDGQVGDWIKTDDHCIIQVLRRGKMLRAKGKRRSENISVHVQELSP